jgi:hypothetical protein
MANTNAPFGFKPVRHLAGGTIRSNEYTINTSGTTGFNDNIFCGDAVVLNADGTIEIGAVANRVTGIFDGCQYVASDGSIVFSRNWVASTAVKTGTSITCWVYDDPNIVFEVQATTYAATDKGLIIDHVVGTGNTSTGQSGSYADMGDTTVTSGGFRVLGLVPRVGNEVGSYARIEVKMSDSTLASTVSV